MEGLASNASILVIPEPEVEKYNNIVRVPPKCMVQLMSRFGGANLSGIKFDGGILSRVCHYSNVTFDLNQISVQVNLQQRDDKCRFYTLMKPFYLELISEKEVKSRHEMHFQSASDSVSKVTLLYHASWVNDGSWDETIDSLRIVFQACRETAGICYNSALWYNRSVQCKAALAEYEKRDYKEIFLDTYTSDVTILCRGEFFPAHKRVLSERSPVFKKILSQDLQTRETLTINEFDPEVMNVFLKFMYSGEYHFMRESLCNSLFDVAYFYQVGALRMLCEHQLTDLVTEDNCLEYFRKSVKFEAPLLKEQSWEIIAKNCNKPVFTNKYKEKFKFFLQKFPELRCELELDFMHW